MATDDPHPSTTTAPYVRRVVVLLKNPVSNLLFPARGVSRSPGSGLRLEPYVPSAQVMTQMSAGALPGPDSAADRLRRYYTVAVPEGVSAEEALASLAADDDILLAYLEPGPSPPPSPGDANPLGPLQGYLDDAPIGISARWAWTRTEGAEVGFVDLEQGWTLGHEDLSSMNIVLISGLNLHFRGHGTAVLGQIGARNNQLGGRGIATACAMRVVSEWQFGEVHNVAEAITSAAAVMRKGDVLLLEAQTSYDLYEDIPVEVHDAVFDAVRVACDAGIIVVEAAGNGGVDLDQFMTKDGHELFKRESPTFRDSGAILVGSATMGVPHHRLPGSCHGSRVDCFAWGEGVTTCGDGWEGDEIDTYTNEFDGTSAASAVVAGAAVLSQAWWKKSKNRVLSPAQMRSMLSDPNLLLANGSRHTASANPAADRIGVMPNMRCLL